GAGAAGDGRGRANREVVGGAVEAEHVAGARAEDGEGDGAVAVPVAGDHLVARFADAVARAVDVDDAVGEARARTFPRERRGLWMVVHVNARPQGQRQQERERPRPPAAFRGWSQPAPERVEVGYRQEIARE